MHSLSYQQKKKVLSVTESTKKRKRENKTFIQSHMWMFKRKRKVVVLIGKNFYNVHMQA